MTKTTFFAGLSPWAGLAEPEPTPKTKAKPKRQEPAPDMLEIANDPPKKRPAPVSKYEQVFSKLQPGQCIKCETRHTHAVTNALRSWQKRRGLKWQTKMTLDYGDGFGRVWRLT